MSRKKISTTIYVTPEQSDRLRLLHERTKVPIAVYIREGIDLVLEQYGHLLPGQLPLKDGATLVVPKLGADGLSDGTSAQRGVVNDVPSSSRPRSGGADGTSTEGGAARRGDVPSGDKPARASSGSKG
jgi:Ribbon-helix-helix domain